MSDKDDNITMTIRLTPQMTQYLADLAKSKPDRYGDKAKTAAERLLKEEIDKLIKQGILNERSR